MGREIIEPIRPNLVGGLKYLLLTQEDDYSLLNKFELYYGIALFKGKSIKEIFRESRNMLLFGNNTDETPPTRP